MPAGLLYGRTDPAACLDDDARVTAVRAAVGLPKARIVSPARRAKETAAALWPNVAAIPEDPRLWEQDFGAWDGLPFDQIPDIGALSGDELADHKPPGGESFRDLCDRVWPALLEIAAAGPETAIVAHAGVVRAGIALAIGAPAPALKFEAAPLSITRLRCFESGRFAVTQTNWLPQ